MMMGLKCAGLDLKKKDCREPQTDPDKDRDSDDRFVRTVQADQQRISGWRPKPF